MVFAVVVVAGLSLLTVSAMDALSGDPDETVGLGVVDASTTSTTEARTGTRRSTTTTTRPRATTTTAPSPEVLGEVTERDPDGAPAPTTTLAPAAAAAPVRPAAPPPPADAPGTAIRF